MIVLKINKDIIRQARQANLVEYLESCHNYTFKTQGKRMQCKEHDSLIITAGNAYYWNSKNDKGNSIDFLIRHLNMDFKTALKELTSTQLEDKKNSFQVETEKSLDYVVTKEYLNRAYAYLNKQRNIENTIISNLVEKGYMRIITGSKYKYPVIGFTIFNNDKKIIGYELQGTLHKVKFKGLTPDVVDSNYGFNFSIGKPTKAYFFESAIDLISFYQLWKSNNLTVNLNGSILVSMAGLKVSTLTNTLRAFKIDSKPLICVDNDTAGTNFKNSLNKQGIPFEAIDIPTPSDKDWNDYLKYVKRAI